ncbi:MAG TPA: ATPase, T2SS/T4P/T4SS family [Candidatus Hydrogenedentes bacterium]|nr:ATPase, T2SS/T4P/T4SS family [Candidatus Hydrogenedentota bacterium]
MAGISGKHEFGDELVRQEVLTREELDAIMEREEATGVPWYRQLIQKEIISVGALEDLFRYEYHSKAKRQQDESIGATLVKMGEVTKEDLKKALAEQKRTGRLLGKILLDGKIVGPEALAKALARQHKLEYATLPKTSSHAEALEAVPESVARKYKFIPVRIEGDRLTALIGDPRVLNSLEDAEVFLGKRIHPILSHIDNFNEELKKRYGKRATAALDEPEAPPPKAAPRRRPESVPEKMEPSKALKQGEEKQGEVVMIEEIVTEETTLDFAEIARQASGASVMQLVSKMIEGAVNSGATDIHLDPQEPEMRVRYRIDGVLHDVMSIDHEIEAAVVSRVKIMADMDITETRHPQDGHIAFDFADKEFDIRVATLPCFLGERVVLRLLDASAVLQGIKDLGLETEDIKKLSTLIQQPYGMILVTGPTGSGKTTTLYAALNQKNVLTESIVTLEDPVEYQLSGINQVQIETEIGVSFANTLRAAMRQDIDVLLVGEIRDAETARIAIRAAMTGHLVFSTLHTNDAPEAISTLRNMDVPSYLLASSLTAVVAQRLVRKVCPKCKKAFTPAKAMLKSLNLPESTKKLYRGEGCTACYHTGTKGRTGIFEVLEITPQIRQMIAADESTEKICRAAKLKTMADRCRNKVKEGIIPPEEFLRVIRT